MRPLVILIALVLLAAGWSAWKAMAAEDMTLARFRCDAGICVVLREEVARIQAYIRYLEKKSNQCTSI